MKRILAIVLTVLALFSLAACGETEPAETPQVILDYVEVANSSIGSAGSNDATDFELSARGTSLVYKYTYKTDSNEEWIKSTKENIRKMQKEEKEYQKASLVIIQKDCPEVTSLIYEYYDKNGTLIHSFEIK